MTLAYLPSPAPARQPGGPLSEACYAWVTMPRGDSGFIAFRSWGVTLSVDPLDSVCFPDSAAAVRSFSLFSRQHPRYRAGAALRLVEEPEALRAGRVALAADVLATAISGAPAEDMTDNLLQRAACRRGWFGGRGPSNNPDLVQPIGLWTRPAGNNG